MCWVCICNFQMIIHCLIYVASFEYTLNQSPVVLQHINPHKHIVDPEPRRECQGQLWPLVWPISTDATKDNWSASSEPVSCTRCLLPDHRFTVRRQTDHNPNIRRLGHTVDWIWVLYTSVFRWCAKHNLVVRSDLSVAHQKHQSLDLGLSE